MKLRHLFLFFAGIAIMASCNQSDDFALSQDYDNNSVITRSANSDDVIYIQRDSVCIDQVVWMYINPKYADNISLIGWIVDTKNDPVKLVTGSYDNILGVKFSKKGTYKITAILNEANVKALIQYDINITVTPYDFIRLPEGGSVGSNIMINLQGDGIGDPNAKITNVRTTYDGKLANYPPHYWTFFYENAGIKDLYITVEWDTPIKHQEEYRRTVEIFEPVEYSVFELLPKSDEYFRYYETYYAELKNVPPYQEYEVSAIGLNHNTYLPFIIYPNDQQTKRWHFSTSEGLPKNILSFTINDSHSVKLPYDYLMLIYYHEKSNPRNAMFQALTVSNYRY